MEAEVGNILELALGQGLWAALYIYLFFHMLKGNAARESQYQAMIANLSNRIQEDIEQIRDKLDKLPGKGA